MSPEWSHFRLRLRGSGGHESSQEYWREPAGLCLNPEVIHTIDFKTRGFMNRRLFSFIFCFLLFAVPSIAGDTAKRAFTLEDLYRIRGIEDLHVSPDGKTVLFTLQTSDVGKAKRTSHIWLLDTDTKKARQFTFGEKSESSPIFSPDAKRIAFISSRDGEANLYVISTSGGEARRLTNTSTGVSDPLWSPDGKWIAFSSDV